MTLPGALAATAAAAEVSAAAAAVATLPASTPPAAAAGLDDFAAPAFPLPAAVADRSADVVDTAALDGGLAVAAVGRGSAFTAGMGRGDAEGATGVPDFAAAGFAAETPVGLIEAGAPTSFAAGVGAFTGFTGDVDAAAAPGFAAGFTGFTAEAATGFEEAIALALLILCKIN